MSPGFSVTGTHDGGHPSNSMPSSPLTSISPIFIRAQVNNTYRNIVIDTGSAITIISRNLLQHIQHNNFRSKPKSYSSANCTLIDIIGDIELEIKINGIDTYVVAAVASTLVVDILLGTDWITRHVTSLNISDHQLTIRDYTGHTTTTSIYNTMNSNHYNVLLINQLTIPPYSDRIVDVNIQIPDQSNVLFEPAMQLYRKSIFVPNAIVHVENHTTKLVIQNTNDHSYTIPRNTCLGIVSGSPIICATSSSHDFTTTDRHSPVSSTNHVLKKSIQCYVCNRICLSDNDLHHHLRTQCFPSELRQQIERLTKHINDTSQQQKLQDILWKYGKLFDLRTPSVINTTLKNAIDTTNHRPIHTPPYRRSPKDHQAITNEVEKLLQQQRIEPSVSPWSSPVVLVRKKDGTTRFCVDYRRLNDITVKDSFPLPRIDDIFDQLSTSTYFTKLDFKNGYFQIPLDPHDRPKTAFSTRDNHYQFTVLPQGVKNGPPTFQRIVNQVLGPTRWKYCLAYIDDVIIFSTTFDEHIIHLEEVLKLLAGFNFRLGVDKCDIATDNIDYLGHHIDHGQIRPNADNIRGLLHTSVPTTPKEVFRFVKAAEFYRKFIPNFSRIAGPLYKYQPISNRPHINMKSPSLILSSDEKVAFDTIKHILTTDLVLRLPNNDLPFKVQTDASQFGIGAVLLQSYPEGDRPVAYLSKKLTPAQQRWAPIEQECYAIVSAIEQWHPYLHGANFVLESDHKPLETLMRKSQLNNKCERWRLKLQSYSFIVKHIKGKFNNMSDYLSRSPVDVATEDPDDQINHHFTSAPVASTLVVGTVTTRSHARQQLQPNHNHVVPPSTDSSNSINTSPVVPSSSLMTDDLRINFTGDLHELKAAQQLDDHLQHIVRNLSDHRYKESYFVSDGVLMHCSNDRKPVPCVPKGKFRSDIMRIYHDTPANGAHFGRDKTVRKIKDRYYWDSMNQDISNYVRSCFLCSQNNPIRRKAPGHLKPIAPPAGVWELLAMDFHGPITPTSQRGNKYIISLTDILSKFVIAKAVRDCTAETAARFLQEEVICKYGTPKSILTDNGTHFTSKIMDSLFHRLGVHHLYSTPYHPQTNGQIERFNSTMDAKIATLANARRTDWDIQLPYVIFNYNATVHSSTRIIPFELMYGRSVVLPCDPQDPVVSLSQDPHHVNKLTQYISDLANTAQTNIIHLQTQYKTRYDSNRSNPTYNVGDLVLVRTFSPRHKFSIRHEGPFQIVQRLSTKTYIVQHIKITSFVRQVTVDSIIPLFERTV